ncbi:MAG: thioredoxin-dependent thiol peroxidase [Pseudomonadota bacterium]|nr:thioredoxin-dependent thiol peroxidase [Pseudomonadota bacterium]
MLDIGDTCPHFQTISESGKSLTLGSFSDKKLVLFFYPKDMTPGCTIESCNFNDKYSEIIDLGAEVVGVSKDSQKSHIKFKEKYGFKYDLLVDEDCTICESFGVLQEKSMFGKKYMGIVRSTFIVNEDGKIIKVWPKVKINGHVDEVIEFLKTC